MNDTTNTPAEWTEARLACSLPRCTHRIERLDVDVCPDHRWASMIPAVLSGERRLSSAR